MIPAWFRIVRYNTKIIKKSSKVSIYKYIVQNLTSMHLPFQKSVQVYQRLTNKLANIFSECNNFQCNLQEFQSPVQCSLFFFSFSQCCDVFYIQKNTCFVRTLDNLPMNGVFISCDSLIQFKII